MAFPSEGQGIPKMLNMQVCDRASEFVPMGNHGVYQLDMKGVRFIPSDSCTPHATQSVDSIDSTTSITLKAEPRVDPESVVPMSHSPGDMVAEPPAIVSDTEPTMDQQLEPSCVSTDSTQSKDMLIQGVQCGSDQPGSEATTTPESPPSPVAADTANDDSALRAVAEALASTLTGMRERPKPSNSSNSTSPAEPGEAQITRRKRRGGRKKKRGPEQATD